MPISGRIHNKLGDVHITEDTQQWKSKNNTDDLTGPGKEPDTKEHKLCDSSALKFYNKHS